MAGIKAGTAYVAIELAGVSSLRRQISNQVTSALSAAGSAASSNLARIINGRVLAQRFAQQFGSGLSSIGSSIGTPFIGSLRSIASSAGVTAARSFVSDFGAGLGGVASGGSFRTMFSTMIDSARTAGVQIANSIGQGFRNIPSIVSGSISSAVSGFRQLGSAAVTAGQIALNGLARMSSGLQSVARTAGMAGYQIQMLGVIGSLAFTAPVVGVGILGAAIGVKFASQIEDAQVALKALLPAGYDVAALVKRLQQIAIQSPVFDSASVITFTQRMVAAGIEIGKTERFIKAFGNIAVTVGIPMDKMTLALQAFSQMAGKGVVNMEELRQQLGDALPGALKIAADGLGITQAKLFELVKKGKVNADQLLDAFIKVGESGVYLQGASAGAETLRSRWNQLVETVQSKLANAVLANMDGIKAAFDKAMPSIDVFIDAISKAFPKAIEYIGKLVGYISDAINWYKSLSDENQRWVNILAAVAVIGGPILAILGTLSIALGGIAAGLALVISPTGAIVAGIIAIAVAGKFLYDWLVNLYNTNEKFRTTLQSLAEAFNARLKPTIMDFVNLLKGSLSKAWDTIVAAIEKVKPHMEGLKVLFYSLAAIAVVAVGVIIAILGGVFKAIGPVIEAIGSLISGVIQIVVGVVQFIYHLFMGDFGKLATDLRLIWDGLWSAIVSTVFNLGKAIWAFLSGFVETIVGFFQMLYDTLVGHSIVPDLINGIVNWFKSLPGKVIAFVTALVVSVVSFFLQLAFNVGQAVRELVTSAVEKFTQIRDKFAEIARAVVDKVSSLISEVGKIPGKILSGLGNMGSLLYSAGKDIISGLIRGISDMAGALKDKARGIADSVKSTINGALDINSPSRVMMKTGAGIIEGLVAGVQKDMVDVRSVMEDVASGIRVAASGATSVVTVNHNDEARRAASLYIENYNAAQDDDPATQAEKWAWINSTRGWAQ